MRKWFNPVYYLIWMIALIFYPFLKTIDYLGDGFHEGIKDVDKYFK